MYSKNDFEFGIDRGMERIQSMSSFDEGASSIVTGDSTQMMIEGQWDETVPLSEIHEGIVEHLTQRLEKLKALYKGLKMKSGASGNREELLMKKIVHARMNYQRYIAATKDILTRCGEFVRTQRDTPETRIAFIRNAQDYFSQAKDFVRLDLSLRRISPTLLRYIEPKTTDSPDVYSRKRELCRAMVGVLGKERSIQISTGAGKVFRSKYIRQGKLFFRGFPEQWIPVLPPVLKDILKDVEADRRWPLTIIFIFSGYCSRVYVHQGFCSGCYFPILRDTEDIDSSGGKLFCHSCGKEVEWTYYISPQAIQALFSSFHPKEIEDMKILVRSRVVSEHSVEEDVVFGDFLESCFQTMGMDSEEELPDSSSKFSTSPSSKKTVSPGEGRGRPRLEKQTPSPEYLFNIVPFRDVSERVRNFVRRVYSDETLKIEQRIRDIYQGYRSEIQAFEGCVEEEKYPRGLFSKIDKYVRHYYKVPTSEEVRELPLDEFGGKRGTSRGMILSALSSLNQSNLLNQTSLLCEKLWGYKLPDLSRHRDQIIYECVLQKEVFLRLSSDIGRKSNLNQTLILMYIIQRHGYPWTERDFHISFSENTIKKQTEILGEIFKIIDQ